jgi:DNA polymerase-4
VVVAPRHAHYRSISAQVFAIFARYTPHIEPLSLDEAFLDVTHSRSLFGDGPQVARRILTDLHSDLQLSASAGVAPCKFVAKIASDLRKPAGLVCVPDAQVVEFLAPLAIEKIWGVGKVAAARLHTAGLHTMGQVAAQRDASLAALLGKLGPHIGALSRGHDPRAVVSDAPSKSISAEETFAQDIADRTLLLPILLAQALKVAARLRAGALWARCVHVKLKYADFHSETRQASLAEPTTCPDTFYAKACALLQRFFCPQAVRLVGLGVSDLLQEAPAPKLFADPAQLRRERLEAVRAAAEQRFGHQALTRASLLEPP